MTMPRATSAAESSAITNPPSGGETNPTSTDADQTVVSVRHYGRVTFSVIVTAAVLFVGYALATNPYIDWGTVGTYFTNGAILRGLWVTLQLSVISMAIALVLAVILAVMRISDSRIISSIAWGYVFLFRGIPLIVLLILVGNLGLFVKTIELGIPFTDITFFSAPTKDVVTPFVASLIGLALCGSAYMSEIVRGGLLAVHRGQHVAAKALGMTGMQTLRYIILPQALRVIVPPLGNEFVNTLKATALVSVIAGGDLLTIAQSIAGVNYKVIELMIVATIWYLIVISVWSVVQYFVERKTAER